MKKQQENSSYRDSLLNRPRKQPYRKNKSNTGDAFENLIIYSNNLYYIKGMAFIQKLEVPVLIQKKHAGGKVSGILKKSTVDFLGSDRQGRMIAFDAKSTSSATSFPLANVEEHQYEILEKYHEMKAISFLLIEWFEYGETYCVPLEQFATYWKEAKRGGKKSIPYQEFVQHFFKAEKNNRGIPLDYLAAFNV